MSPGAGAYGVVVMMDLEEVYRRLGPRLMRLATAIAGPDAAGDVFMTVWARMVETDALSRVRNPDAYLHRAIVNAAYNHHRTDRRRLMRDHGHIAERTRRAVEPDVALTVELATTVASMLEGLSPGQRAVLFLSYWEDLDVEAVARLLGLSDGSVRRHLARARANVRKMRREP